MQLKFIYYKKLIHYNLKMFNKRFGQNLNNIDLNNMKKINPKDNMNNSPPHDDTNDEINEDNEPKISNIQSKISSKNDIPIMKDMLEDQNLFMTIMKNRVNNLSKISTLYKSGKIEDSYNKVCESGDIGIMSDAFRHLIIKKDINKLNINIDIALKIFPCVIKMVESKHDPYVKVGINTAWTLLNYFSEQIMEVFKTPVSKGVDINREEKISKYKMFVDYFCKLRDNPRFEYNLKYKEIKGVNLKQFIGEVNFFISQCRN